MASKKLLSGHTSPVAVFEMFRKTLRRLPAIDDPPERTALALSVGIFATFQPFPGLHTILYTFPAFVFGFNEDEGHLLKEN